MPNDLDLTRVAASYDVPPGDLDAVVTRARHRTRRRRAAAATVTTIAVVAGAASFIGTRGTGGRDIGVTTQPGASAQRGDDGLRWAQVDNAHGLSWFSPAGGPAPLYALSTAPGERRADARPNGSVYRTADGVDWQAVSRLGDDLFLADLAPSSGRVYGVGTGPATAAAPGRKPASDLVAGWSDDGGRTWDKVALKIDMHAISAKTLQLSTFNTRVVSSDKGTLVVAVLTAGLDVPAVLPAGATAPNGWVTTDSGVDVLGPRKGDPCPAGTKHSKDPTAGQATPGESGPIYCDDGNGHSTTVRPQDAWGVTGQYSWAQLGVDGDLLAAVRSQPLAFFAPAGTTNFERAHLADNRTSGVAATAAADGFDVVLGAPADPVSTRTQTQKATVLHSSDGRTWNPSTLQTGTFGVSALGQLAGRSALVSADEQGPMLMREADGGGWATTHLGNLVDVPAGSSLFLGQAGIGPAGVAVVTTVAPDGRSKAAAEATRKPNFWILTSRDGVTWKVQQLDELAGRQTTGVEGVVVTADRIVLTIGLPSDKPRQPSPTLTMVGTVR
jgi:hypothetical protein